MKAKALAIVCLFAAGLAGCLLPETIDAKINLDGYCYKVVVSGRLVSTDALNILLQGQQLTEKMEDSLRSAENDASAETGYKTFKYVKDGRYDAVVELSGELTKPKAAIGFPITRTETLNNNNFLTIERMLDGTIEVRTPRLSEQQKQDFAKAGLLPVGTIEITTFGKVLASSAPEQQDKTVHRWKLSSLDDYVFLKLAVP